MQYTTFYVGDALYGVPILAVREISRHHNITPVQGADERIEGLMNLRGQIVTVLNLGACLNNDPISQGEDMGLMIFKNNKELSNEAVQRGISTSYDNVALLVNRIGDVVGADDVEVEPSPAHIPDEFISGVIKLNEKLLTILSIDWLCHLQKENKELQN